MPDAKPPLGGRQLLHRWFVQYNPLYLLSAALVLVGVSLLSSALVGESFWLAQLGVPLVAETYGWALIGGAALLYRIDSKRPAVMLAVLATLYQCDVTLHTVSSVYLGGLGLAAGFLWWISFVAKLHALVWAMRLRVSLAVHAVAILGSFGLMLVPQVLRRGGPSAGVVVASMWLFGLVASAAWTTRAIDSEEALDPWGQTVLRRARRVVWVIWGTGAAAHVTYWCAELGLSKAVVVPVAMLCGARFIRRETTMVAVMAAVLGFVALEAPSHTAATSLFAALAVALRAWRTPVQRSVDDGARTGVGPYRTRRAPSRPPRMRTVFVVPDRIARHRMVMSTAFFSYLALWTWGWAGTALPEHMLWLDLLLSAGAAAWVARDRYYPALAPAAGVHAHHAVAVGLLAWPATLLGWGLLSVGVGFGLLACLLGVAYGLQRGWGREPGSLDAR